MNTEIIAHYDALIDENNDPFRDPEPLKTYMDKWDGPLFLQAMQLSPEKSVLEIGVGTGRVAAKAAPLCGSFTGIDISPNTILRAGENLCSFPRITLIVGDFMKHPFSETFDVVYSTLTLMHFADKQGFVSKAAALLRPGGRLCLSIDKNPADYISYGSRRVRIYPDTPQNILRCISGADLKLHERLETEFAYIFVCTK